MPQDIDFNTLGASIEGSETNFVGIDSATGKVNDINSTNFKSLDGSNLTNLPSSVDLLQSGTVTLATTTAAYDVDYADIAIAASSLGVNDILVIEIIGYNGGDKQILAKVNFNDVTSAVATTDLALMDNANAGERIYKFIQSPVTNDEILYSSKGVYNTTVNNSANKLDTNDANIFTTAFTIRINFRNSAQPASASAKFNYIVYVIRGA